MANKKFTDEEMKHLHASAYVIDVSPSIVHFFAGFNKKKFWEAFLEGNKPRDIVIQLGIYPDILEKNRINGLKVVRSPESDAPSLIHASCGVKTLQ